MKCSHGGCQTDAVVLITPATYHSFENAYLTTGNPRGACRFHMAIICEENQANIVSTL
jgi:hypothetical protein